MLFSNLNFFVITLFTLNLLFIKTYISLDFTYINKKTGNNVPDDSSIKEYFSSLIYNPIYTTLTINDKETKFHITMDRYSTYISEKNLKNIDPKAADEKNEKGNLCSLNYIGIPIALYTNSSFSFMVNNSKSINPKLSFFMPKQMINDSQVIKEYCYASETEEIGLNINKGNKLFEVSVEYNPEDDDYRYDDDDDYRYDDEDDYYVNVFDYNNDDNEDKIYKNDGYYIEENTYNCVGSIPQYGYYLSNSVTGLFSPCHTDCKTCSIKYTETNTNCNICNNQDYNFFNGNCIENCPDGYYSYEDNSANNKKTCTKC